MLADLIGGGRGWSVSAVWGVAGQWWWEVAGWGCGEWGVERWGYPDVQQLGQ